MISSTFKIRFNAILMMISASLITFQVRAQISGALPPIIKVAPKIINTAPAVSQKNSNVISDNDLVDKAEIK